MSPIHWKITGVFIFTPPKSEWRGVFCTQLAKRNRHKSGIRRWISGSILKGTESDYIMTESGDIAGIGKCAKAPENPTGVVSPGSREEWSKT